MELLSINDTVSQRQTAQSIVSDLTVPSASVAGTPTNVALSPTHFVALTIRDIADVSPNTKAFDILLPHAHDITGLVTSAFIMVIPSLFDSLSFTRQLDLIYLFCKPCVFVLLFPD